jgi:hypothetical protein
MWKSMAVAFGLQILRSLAQAAYDALWAIVIDSVDQAERKWIESGKGKVKKEWVLERATEWMESKKLIRWYNAWAVRAVLSAAVDAIIKELNDNIGSAWGQKVSDIRRILAPKIPFVD